jgi:hypothetical protein
MIHVDRGIYKRLLVRLRNPISVSILFSSHVGVPITDLRFLGSSKVESLSLFSWSIGSGAISHVSSKRCASHLCVEININIHMNSEGNRRPFLFLFLKKSNLKLKLKRASKNVLCKLIISFDLFLFSFFIINEVVLSTLHQGYDCCLSKLDF